MYGIYYILLFLMTTSVYVSTMNQDLSDGYLLSIFLVTIILFSYLYYDLIL